MTKKSNIALVILLVLSAVFCIINFWLITPVKTNTNILARFDSPDETANYFWAKNYAQTGQLKITEPLNSIAKNQIHPRSFNVMADGSLVPGTFLGLIILFGLMAKIFGLGIIIYLTPILAVFGILAFYGIIKKVFNPEIGFVSAVVLIFHPVWWYYSVISLYPNIAFVSLALIGIYFLLTAEKKYWWLVLLGGLSLGLALTIRMSEAIWLLFIVAVVLFCRKEKLNTLVILPFAVIGLAMVVALLFNQQLYGSWLVTGYNQLHLSTSTCQTCQIFGGLFLPFGFHPLLALKNFWHYFVSLSWWLMAFGLIGFGVWLAKLKKIQTSELVFVLVSIVVGAFLSLYYGSLVYSDTIIQRFNLIGLSYVRYWLPLFILVIPFVAIGLIWLGQRLGRRLKNYVIVLFLIILLYQSASLVVFLGDDSLNAMRKRIASYKEISAQVTSLTQPNAIIVTVRQDKVFFPDRKVIHTFEPLLQNQELMGILPALVGVVPVYYFSPEVIRNQTANGIKLNQVAVINSSVLYRLDKAEAN